MGSGRPGRICRYGAGLVRWPSSAPARRSIIVLPGRENSGDPERRRKLTPKMLIGRAPPPKEIDNAVASSQVGVRLYDRDDVIVRLHTPHRQWRRQLHGSAPPHRKEPIGRRARILRTHRGPNSEPPSILSSAGRAALLREGFGVTQNPSVNGCPPHDMRPPGRRAGRQPTSVELPVLSAQRVCSGTPGSRLPSPARP